jgi:cob(I)alamin adenosyltransferase
MKKNMIHLYCGDGKGKTSAAAGLLIRARGWDIPCAAVQFLKGSPSGEVKSLEKLGVAVFRCREGLKFLWDMTEQEKQELKAQQTEMLEKALALRPEMLMLDELCDAYSSDTAERALVDDLLKAPPCELVITGHKPDEIFFQQADYITEMKKLAHPFDKGAAARRGVEF